MSRNSTALDTLFAVSTKAPQGKRKGIYATATCGCGNTADVYAASGNGALMPPEPVARKFRQLGWRMAAKNGKHVCPACQQKPETPRAAPPPKPKPEDRRSILEALEIVFCPVEGFDMGYDDARVAEEKNVPRKWVEEVRETLLGPVPAPKVDHIGEARKILKAVHDDVTALADLTNSCNDIMARLRDKEKLVAQHLEAAGG